MKFAALMLASALTVCLSGPALAETRIITTNSGKTKAVQLPDEKNPWLTGICSFVIPGVGQMVNGDWGAGLLHLGANVLMFGLASSNASTATGWQVARLGLNIYSVYDAASRSNHLNDERLAIYNHELNSELPGLNLTAGRQVSDLHVTLAHP